MQAHRRAGCPARGTALAHAAAERSARILRHPQVHPGRIELTLCTRDGLSRLVVTKGERAAWLIARDLR